ncbi:MAG: hypothetical protein Q4P14_05345 [Methanobacteriaceae archaeon]|nr:hypothetical protein [Methanobacteriaceae archaeon]
MENRKLTYEDVKPYEGLVSKIPTLILKRMISKNSNLVSKFESVISSNINNLDSQQKEQLNILLNSDIDELQALSAESYEKSGIKAFKLMADPNCKDFIELNLGELKKLLSEC